MFKSELAKRGDILNYKPTDMMGSILAYGGSYCHTSVISKIIDGKFWIIESHIATGVVEKELNPKWYSTIDIRRVSLTDQEIDDFIMACRVRIGCKYALKDFRPTIRGLVLAQIGINIRNKPAWGNDPMEFYCTELIAESLWVSTKHELVRDVHYSQDIPSDVGWSKTNAILIS